MEAITRLVADSLARHGLDRPVDPRRLQWSRWSRCDSPHSLLVVPSKPGIFALAEEVLDLGATTAHVGTAALVRPAEPSSAAASTASTLERISADSPSGFLGGERSWGEKFSGGERPSGGAALQRCDSLPGKKAALAAEARRMLAVLQFSEDDDMAFTLDRMFTRINPMRARLSSGKCFLRFVIIEDQAQRRSICAALNQWMLNSSEKATGIPAGFSTSLEFTTDRVGRTLLSDSADTISKPAPAPLPKPDKPAAPFLASGAAKNLHCPHPLPSGF
jgi:hypothetical protein